jgi:hypothetical protein
VLASKVRRGPLSASQDLASKTASLLVLFRSAKLEVAAPVKGVTPIKEVEGTQPLEICQRSASFEYLQFQCPVLQIFCSRSGGVDEISPCSHLLRQPVADMKVTGTWQVNSSARGKSHLRLGLCMSAGIFYSITTLR